MSWRLKGKGDFGVCTFNNDLRGPGALCFSWNSIWSVKAPRRVDSRVWTTWEKILTFDRIIKGWYTLVG